jgi:hypothetical protein
VRRLRCLLFLQLLLQCVPVAAHYRWRRRVPRFLHQQDAIAGSSCGRTVCLGLSAVSYCSSSFVLVLAAVVLAADGAAAAAALVLLLLQLRRVCRGRPLHVVLGAASLRRDTRLLMALSQLRTLWLLHAAVWLLQFHIDTWLLLPTVSTCSSTMVG